MDICDKCHQPIDAIQAPYRSGGGLQINEPKLSGLKRITSYLWWNLWYNRGSLFRSALLVPVKALVGVAMLGIILGVGMALNWLLRDGIQMLGVFVNSFTFKHHHIHDPNAGVCDGSAQMMGEWLIGAGSLIALPIIWFLGSCTIKLIFPPLTFGDAMIRNAKRRTNSSGPG